MQLSKALILSRMKGKQATEKIISTVLWSSGMEDDTSPTRMRMSGGAKWCCSSWEEDAIRIPIVWRIIWAAIIFGSLLIADCNLRRYWESAVALPHPTSRAVKVSVEVDDDCKELSLRRWWSNRRLTATRSPNLAVYSRRVRHFVICSSNSLLQIVERSCEWRDCTRWGVEEL